MPLNRAFVQQQQPLVSFPNNSSVTEMVVGTSSVVILPARPAGNRRGFAIENDGSTPIVIGYAPTVSVAARSFRIEAKGSNDATDYFEDPFIYQGAVSALSVGAAGGTINITELTII